MPILLQSACGNSPRRPHHQIRTRRPRWQSYHQLHMQSVCGGAQSLTRLNFSPSQAHLIYIYFSVEMIFMIESIVGRHSLCRWIYYNIVVNKSAVYFAVSTAMALLNLDRLSTSPLRPPFTRLVIKLTSSRACRRFFYQYHRDYNRAVFGSF